MKYPVYRLAYVFLGAGFLVAGYLFLDTDYFNWYGSHIFVGKGRYLISLVAIISGFLLIYMATRTKFIPTLFGKREYYKCSKCGALFQDGETKDNICNKCGGSVENLAGFYNRHPEQRRW